MLNAKIIREIKKREEAGYKVIVIGKNGTLYYESQADDNYNQNCNECKHLKLISDKSPKTNNKKIVCLGVKAVIAEELELSECTNVCKPLYCPMLGRRLTEEEKKEAKKELILARKRFKKL